MIVVQQYTFVKENLFIKFILARHRHINISCYIKFLIVNYSSYFMLMLS